MAWSPSANIAGSWRLTFLSTSPFTSANLVGKIKGDRKKQKVESPISIPNQISETGRKEILPFLPSEPQNRAAPRASIPTTCTSSHRHT